MLSREIIRQYTFFAGLDTEQLDALVDVAEHQSIPADHVFFREDELIDRFYVLVSGTVAAFLQVPDTSQRQSLAEQLAGQVRSTEVAVSTVGVGEVFGFSALVPPPMATAGAKALTPCRVIAFDVPRLFEKFESNYRLGYIMTQKAASVMRIRLRDLHIENLMLRQSCG